MSNSTNNWGDTNFPAHYKYKKEVVRDYDAELDHAIKQYYHLKYENEQLQKEIDSDYYINEYFKLKEKYDEIASKYCQQGVKISNLMKENKKLLIAYGEVCNKCYNQVSRLHELEHQPKCKCKPTSKRNWKLLNKEALEKNNGN